MFLMIDFSHILLLRLDLAKLRFVTTIRKLC